MRVAGVDLAPHVLGVLFAGGRELELHALQLRDGCPCAECRHPVTGQRLLESASIPLDLTLESARPDADGSGVLVEWSDGHAARFRAADLAGPEEPAPTLWDAGLAGSLPEAAWDDVVARPDVLHQWLAAVDELGFALLRGVPVEHGAVCRVAELFGHVRETNYGRWFDVRTVADPDHLADTNVALALHTDNPYRDPVPGIQLLHCHVASGDGGETILVDGFHAVTQLGLRSPDALALLATTEVRFEYGSATARLVARQPVVQLDSRGAPRAVRFNNRSKQLPAVPLDRVRSWYAAYAELAALLEDPANRLELLLQPGDLVCFDNERILHGRRAFRGDERLLQGCYADRDGLRSTLALLRSATREVQWTTA